MSDIIFIIFIALILIASGWYFYDKFKKSKNNNLTKNSLDKDFVAILPKKRKKIVITLEESWKFINDITDKVIAKFSKKDQELLMELGHKLSKLGMMYNHIIEYGVRYNKRNQRHNKNQKTESYR